MVVPELTTIANDLKADRAVPPVTVRDFLWWFGFQRRTWLVVYRIRDQLEEVGIVTVPDFESQWLDAQIRFEPKATLDANTSAADIVEGCIHTDSADIDGHVTDSLINWVRRDATYRLSKLAAANAGVVPVAPDAPLRSAITLMMARDFSQLPVMIGEREVKGVISWKSIGSRLTLGHDGSTVRALMDQAQEVKAEASIFDAIPLIIKNDYVLVRGEENKITGIVTASDLSLQFRTLTEPFLLLSEIENLIRNLIGDRCSVAELSSARDPSATDRQIQSVADLTFGEYIRVFENQSRWEQLGLGVDRKIFCKDLDRVREIRNDVTHFDPDGITPADLTFLQNFTDFLKQLEAIQIHKLDSQANC
jgi:predicted transcriptional regulator